MYFAYLCPTKLCLTSWSYTAAIFELELRTCNSRAILVRFSRWSCGSVLCVLHLYYKAAIACYKYTCATELRFSSWSCGSVLRLLHLSYEVALSSWCLRYKAAIFVLELQTCTCTTKLRKCTSCITLVLQSCDFRAGAAEVYFAHYSCTTKLRFSSKGCGSVLRVLHYKAAIFELELRKCASRSTLLLQSCGAAEVCFAYCTCTTQLRFSIWSCGTVPRVLHLCYKAAIFELELRKCTSHTTLVLQSRAEGYFVYFAHYSCTTKLRFSSKGCGSVLRVLHYKAAIFELELRKCTLRTALVLQSCDFRARGAEVHFACYTTKLRFSSSSCGSVLRVVHFCCKVVELRKCASRTALVQHSCVFQSGAAELYFVYYTCATKLRFSSWSCGSVHRILHLCYKVVRKGTL